MSQAVEITFDCLPLRAIGRLDAPLDASPAYQARWARIKRAVDTHGAANAYYLHNAHAVFHLVNSEVVGMLRFGFEGTVKTDASDRRTETVDLEVQLVGETCDWLTGPVTAWFDETVRRAVGVEFDQFIASGNLSRTVRRLETLQAEGQAAGDPWGMYL